MTLSSHSDFLSSQRPSGPARGAAASLLALALLSGCVARDDSGGASAAPASAPGASSSAQETLVSRAYANRANVPATGLALEGYCPVAYFAVNKPLLGKPEFSSDYEGITYRFVSADAKAAFDREPSKYLPAFGGWCAYGAAVGDKFPVDPRSFKIVNGRLLLFLKNPAVDARELWERGREPQLLADADRFWTGGAKPAQQAKPKGAPIPSQSGASRAFLGSRNLPSSGVALEGYCPVAYFAVNKPVRGRPEFSSEHEGVTYYFVSKDAKAAFDREPSKFVPAYGGWCAYGMALGQRFPVDPRSFKIVDGRLLLFLENEGVSASKLWSESGPEGELLSKADQAWSQLAPK